MRILTVLALLFFLTLEAKAAKAKAANTQGGKIYELDSEKKTLLFTMNAELNTSKKGNTVFTSTWHDPDQNEVMTEEANFNGLELQNYLVKQKQLDETYELEISSNEMHFSVNKEGQIKKKTRPLPANLVIGPSFVPFLKLHWAEIQNKKIVEATLAALDFMDVFRFEFEKLRDEKLNGNDVVIVRMKPHSSLVSSVVRPMYFVVSSDGSRILELKGRMLLKKKIGKRWHDLEAEAVFFYDDK